MTEPRGRAVRTLRAPALWQTGGWLMVGFVVWISLAPFDADVELAVNDHIGHVIAYFALMVWFGGIYRRRYHARVALALVGLGLALETAQGIMGFRAVEWLDVAGNLVGIALGAVWARGPAGDWCRWVETRFA